MSYEEITFVGVSLVAEASQPSMSPGAIAGPGAPVQATDYLLAFVNWNHASGNTLEAPAGWTLVPQTEDTATGWQGAVYSAPGSTALGTWTMSPSADFCGMQVLAYRSVDGTPITSASHIPIQNNPLTGAAASFNAQTGDWVVAQWALYNDVAETWTPPAGFTVRSTSNNMLIADSDGAMPGANLQPSASWTPSQSIALILALSLRPSGQNGGTLTPAVTLLGEVAARSNAQTIVNTGKAIPAGAYLRLTAGDASFGASAGEITAVSDNVNGAWTLRHNAGNNDGTHWIQQSVWDLPDSAAAAAGAMTLTVTGTSNTNGNGGLIWEMVTGVRASPIDQEAWDDTNLSGATDEVGQALEDVTAGDLCLASFTTFETDGGFTPDGKQVVVEAINAPGGVVPSVSSFMLDGPAETGTNVLGANYDGPSGGIIMTYAVALLPPAAPPATVATRPLSPLRRRKAKFARRH